MSQQGVPSFPHQENWTETEWKVAGVQFGHKACLSMARMPAYSSFPKAGDSTETVISEDSGDNGETEGMNGRAGAKA